MRTRRACLLSLLCALCGPPAAATQPCALNPCLDYDGTPGTEPRFSAERCRQRASWVAVGAIENVIHHPLPQPFLIDAATFTFRVVRWEKTPAGARPEAIVFQVKWCQQELPANLAPLYRFYGLNAPASVPAENSRYLENPEYLYFVRADEPAGEIRRATA